MQNTDYKEKFPAIIWNDNEQLLELLDQRELPQKTNYIKLITANEIAHAITNMVVRGAPAIGITAAYGVVVAVQNAYKQNKNNWQNLILVDLKTLANSRPTAVNLFWALQNMQNLIAKLPNNKSPIESLLTQAKKIHQADIDANYKMGEFGASLFTKKCNVLTHCNAGALATGGYGTALGVIRSAYKHNKITNVYADETRPWLQGARLTAWEMVQSNIPVTLLADSAAATLMQAGKISWVIVGSDRIAANGDVANKIGTYNLAVIARHHGVKFMVVAPTTTIDMQIKHGNNIPIESRNAEEITIINHKIIAPIKTLVYNPVFDVTPAKLIDVIITEKGIIKNPNFKKLSAIM
jgi:methylthioribose-1-phosphate isomerase